MIIDTHCHLDSKRYDEDLKKVIERAKNKGVKGFLLPGANLEDLSKAKEISYKFDEAFYAAGVHPYHHEQYDEKILREYLNDPRCIAVGECGLDYYRLPKDEDERLAEKEAQKKVFKAQIELAIEFQKPLIVHIREASEDSLNILSAFAAGKVCGGVLHCYNASEILLPLSDSNFYFGIGGVITFKNEKKLGKILPHIPLDKLLLETDAPYLTPDPHRGERNEPFFTNLVVEKMAEILNIETKTLIIQTTNNAKRLFKAFEKLD
ncbi:MAG: TatD family hydrolase [Campylobacteraceae bacterium]|nr:TatD family hydrolase [Campylobacteraceae bacterium]